MMNVPRYIRYSMFAALVAGSLSSCENDLRDVEQISAKRLAVPVDKSTGVELIYSDSALVKAKLITPELLYFKTDSPYHEMKKGVTIIFYDPAQKETSRVVSDYAIRKENQKVVEFRKNVVATNKEGKTFKSDELIWDENKRYFYSNKVVSVITDDNVLNGTSFKAPEDFSYYEIQQGTGDFKVADKQDTIPK